MKLLRYGPKGKELPALLDKDQNIRDLSKIVDDIDGAFLEKSHSILKDLDISSLPIVDGDVRIGACIGNVGKFICVGLNFHDHAEASGAEIPDELVIFNKWTSAIMGPNDDIQLPKNSQATDWEVELGVVIGKEGRYIPEEQAMDYVFGVCLINDLSERDFQFNRGGTVDKGKGCDTFGPIGPYLVSKEEVVDLYDLNMWLKVDGHLYQNSSTKMMAHKIDKIVSYISQFMSLQPGDIISTGTPPGVGFSQNPPIFLKKGQIVELGITGLGEQRQKVISHE